MQNYLLYKTICFARLCFARLSALCKTICFARLSALDYLICKTICSLQDYLLCKDYLLCNTICFARLSALQDYLLCQFNNFHYFFIFILRWWWWWWLTKSIRSRGLKPKLVYLRLLPLATGIHFQKCIFKWSRKRFYWLQPSWKINYFENRRKMQKVAYFQIKAFFCIILINKTFWWM